MLKTDILDKLKSILIKMDQRNASLVDKVTYETKLITELGLNSIGILYMVIAIEETFGIEFDNDKPFVTVGEVVEYIEERVG